MGEGKAGRQQRKLAASAAFSVMTGMRIAAENAHENQYERKRRVRDGEKERGNEAASQTDFATNM